MDLLVEDMADRSDALRVAVVTETWPPEVNGVAMTVARLCDGLVQRRHRVEVVRPRQEAEAPPERGSRFEEVLARGLPIPRYEGLRFGLPARGQLFRLWSHRRPDIVHVVTEGPLGWSALSVARKLKLPVSASFHTNFDVYSRHYGVGWLQGPVEALLRKFHNRADLTFVPTEALLRDLAGRGFQKLEVLARGVDTRQFSPAFRSPALRAAWGVGDSAPVALVVGRVAPEKNLGLALQAFDRMREAQPGARLVIVGDGPERAALQAQRRDLIFAGVRRGRELAEHYASADLFLFPSLSETFGNVTLEAMASGLAVVAFRHAAAAEFVVDGAGCLADSGDSGSFVDHAVRLAADLPLCRQMGAVARQRVQAVDWERVHDSFGTRLAALVRRHDRSRRLESESHFGPET